MYIYMSCGSSKITDDFCMFEIETLLDFVHKNNDHVIFVWLKPYQYTCNGLYYVNFILFQCITIIDSENIYDFYDFLEKKGIFTFLA